MGRAFSSSAAFSDRESGIDIWVEYQDNNLRVRTLNWVVPAGVWARVRIWDGGSLVFDHSIVGPETGNTNVSGNYSMRQVSDVSGVYLDFPLGIEYSVHIANHQWL